MQRRTPLDDTHAGAGVRWIELDGWRVPADFGDPAGEYASLRRGAGLLDLSLRGKLQLLGPDRVAFLDGMVSNDVRGLRPGEGCNAAKLSLNGKMEGGMHVLCLADALWCDIDPGAAAAVQAALARHLIMEDVRIVDVTGTWALIAVQGPEAARTLAAAGCDTTSLGAPLQHAASSVHGTAVRIVRNDHTGEGGFDMWVEAAAAPGVWLALVERGGARPVGMTALDVRRIEAGIPWFGSEITTERFPMEAGLESGWISSTKGCYLGQETIARIHFQGHVNNRLCGLVFDDGVPPPRAATVWRDDKRVGAVTSAATSPRLGRAVALAIVHRTAAEVGTELAVDAAGVRRPATVVALPFA
jgi:folate-binding protein YgfZ